MTNEELDNLKAKSDKAWKKVCEADDAYDRTCGNDAICEADDAYDKACESDRARDEACEADDVYEKAIKEREELMKGSKL